MVLHNLFYFTDRKSRYDQCSSESQELSTRYFRPSSVVCSFRVVTCSLCGVSVTWRQKLVVDRGRVCLLLSLFSDGFSFAIQMDGLTYATSAPVLFFAFDCDGFRSKTVGTHMFTDRGTRLLVFFESCAQWALCLSDVGCLAVCTDDMVHKALWSYQTGPNGVVWSYMGSGMGSHTCLTE